MGSFTPPEEFNVLVTGFDKFKRDYPINPSWEITKDLPPTLEVDGTSPKCRINLRTHNEPIPVNYQKVRKLIPRLWDSGLEVIDPQRQPLPKIDLCVHIGMAGPQKHWSLEQRAHRDGYTMRDVDGNLLGDEERRQIEGDRWIWNDMPKELLTHVDVNDMFERWKGHVPDPSLRRTLRISQDPGHYLCDFIYFSSLAHLEKMGERRKVIFLHVPCNQDPAEIETSKEVALALIRAAVETELARKGYLPQRAID